MPRTPLFSTLARLAALAHAAPPGVTSRELVDQARATRRRTRREFVGTAATAAAALAMAPAAGAAPRRATTVGIVGAGLAGLACADALFAKGFVPTLYDAAPRVGGRCFSGVLPTVAGQVMERGGELIDTTHSTMLGYARRFGLARERQWQTFDGEESFYFGGQHYSAAEVVDEFRAFVPAMREDLRQLSGTTTADGYTPYDAVLDATSLADYFALRGASPLLTAAYGAAYLGEYGLELGEQSALNFLYFAKADKRSKFMPFGVFSDERYHLVEGNDGIARGLAGDLAAGGVPLTLGARLLRAARRADGTIALTFDVAGATRVAVHDAVVLAVPFTTLRQVDLDASLTLPAWKLQAIHELGYGTNAKTMIGFDGRAWAAAGSIGVSYSDLPQHQQTWETNPSRATATQAILTDYASGVRGASLSAAQLQAQVGAFLGDLAQVWPGAAAAARRDGTGAYVAHLEAWPTNPLAQGSYTCYRPGQFTTIAGREGIPVGNLFFAGEHANSFYAWQGFMEGACLSGLDAADAIWRAYR